MGELRSEGLSQTDKLISAHLPRTSVYLEKKLRLEWGNNEPVCGPLSVLVRGKAKQASLPSPPSLGKDSTMCFYRRKSLFFHERFLSINLIDYSEPSRVPMFLVCFPSADEGRRTNIEDEDEKRSNWFSSGKLTNNIYTAFSLLSAWSTRWLSFKDFFFSL